MTYDNGKRLVKTQGKPLSLGILLDNPHFLAEGWGLTPCAYLRDKSIPTLPFGPQSYLYPALHWTGPPALSLLCSPLHIFSCLLCPSPRDRQKTPNRTGWRRGYETYGRRTPMKSP